MEATFTIQVLVLSRQSFRERDSKLVVYSSNKGKLELVARGIKDINSKMAGHLEPITLSTIMVVKGKQFDYAGSAVSLNCYSHIKNNIAKLKIVGPALNLFNQLVKYNQEEKQLYIILLSFLDIINSQKRQKASLLFLYHCFILKLLTQLGYKPQLYNCLICRQKIRPTHNYFNYARGGLICPQCPRGRHSLTISVNCIKVLRLMLEKNFFYLAKLKMEPKLYYQEIKKIISSFLQYNHQITEG